MARGLTSAVKTELATGNINPVHLLHIGFPTPVNLTDCSFNLTSSVSGSSVTYVCSGHLLNIAGVNEASSPAKNSLDITLSGVEQTYISVVLNNNVIGDDVKIYKGFLNSSNGLIADPFLIYYGTIDETNINHNDRSSEVILRTTSHWGNFDKMAGRTTSDNSQQRFFSGDKGMEFAALTVKDIRWGRI